MKQHNKQPFWTIVTRGITGYCPKCGLGLLFTSYLKQVERCTNCNEELGNIRAEDGPAWLTILIVGHILAPFLLIVLPQVTWPDWEILTVIMTLMMVLTFSILPRAKGAFIAMIWRSGSIGEENIK